MANRNNKRAATATTNKGKGGKVQSLESANKKRKVVEEKKRPNVPITKQDSSEEEFDSSDSEQYEDENSEYDEDEEVIEGDEEEEDEEEGDEEEDEEMEENEEGGEQKAPTSGNSSEKRKEKKKALEDQKRKKNEMYDDIQDIKKKWEVIRRRGDIDNVERQKMIQDILDNTIKGRIKEITFKHDCSRIIQSILKHGNQQQREKIIEELIDEVVELAKANYGRYIVGKMLKFSTGKKGNEYRSRIITKFYGKINKLVGQRVSGPLVEEIYSVWANATQQKQMITEFYGPEFIVFKSKSVANKGKNGKSESSAAVKTAKEIVESQPMKREAIIRNLKTHISKLASNENAIRYSILHRLMLEYYSIATENEINDIIAILTNKNGGEEGGEGDDNANNNADGEESAGANRFVEILHTKEGYQVGMQTFYHSKTAKDKKALVKSIKPYVIKCCTDEYAHNVVIAALESVDDTVFVSKTIVSTLVNSANLDQLAKDKFGRRVVLFLIGRGKRDARFLGFQCIKIMKEIGDVIRPKTTKKDLATKFAELASYAIPKITNHYFKSESLTKSFVQSVSGKNNSSNGNSGEQDSQDDFQNQVIFQLILANLLPATNKRTENTKENNASNSPIFSQTLDWLIKVIASLPVDTSCSLNPGFERLLCQLLSKHNVSGAELKSKILASFNPQTLKSLAVKGSFVIVVLLEQQDSEIGQKSRKILCGDDSSLVSQLEGLPSTKNLEIIIRLLKSEC